MNLLIQSIFRKNGKCIIINHGTEITGIGIESVLEKLKLSLVRQGLLLDEKTRNKKLYSAISDHEISEKLIKEILVDAIV